MNIIQQTNKKLILIFLVLFHSLIGQTNVSAFNLEDHTFSLSCAAASSIILSCSAYQVYKQDMIASNKPHSISDFIKKFPHLFKQALLGENRTLHKNHPWFCKATKMMVAGTAIAVVLEAMPDLKDNRQPYGAYNNHVQPANNWNQPFNNHAQPRYNHGAVPVVYQQKHVPKEMCVQQNLRLPAHIDPDIAAERRREEAGVKARNDIVLIEQNFGCLFCHEPFDDNAIGCYYNCNPTHLFHPDCINRWHNHKNNGYGGEPNGCLVAGCVGSGENHRIRPQIHQVRIKLRASQTPGFAPLVPVIDGVITDPVDHDGALVTGCRICKKDS